MDRVILLALLGIPILIVIHAAGVMFLTVDQADGHQWQTTPAYFVVEPAAEGRA
jgi:hypothetical protein